MSIGHMPFWKYKFLAGVQFEKEFKLLSEVFHGLIRMIDLVIILCKQVDRPHAIIHLANEVQRRLNDSVLGT